MNIEDLKILEFKNDHTKSPILRNWVSNNVEKAFSYRGNNKETLLHWAAITDLNLMKDLINYVKLDPNIKDVNGYTAFDWLIERYYLYIVSNNVKTPTGELQTNEIPRTSKLFIANQTFEHSIYLDSIHAKTQYDYVSLFTKSGSIRFTDYLYKKDPNLLLNIGDKKVSIFHNMLLWGDEKEKYETFRKYQLPIDHKDIDGKTALYYAVDALIFKPELADFFFKSITELLHLGANPLEVDHKGQSPYSLFNLNIKKEKKLFEKFEKLIYEK